MEAELPKYSIPKQGLGDEKYLNFFEISPQLINRAGRLFTPNIILQ